MICNIKRFVVPAAFVAGSMLFAAPAFAQATRTWVSGVGDDANPCSRTAPCKTFAGAISKTVAGGEINCIDQGAFGTVTITKAIAIICEGVTAGVLNTGTTGINVNAGASDNVYIRGLNISGGGTGLGGIRFLAGASLTVEDTVIRGSNSNSSDPNVTPYGILFRPSGAARLVVRNTTINNNGNGTAGGGILIQPNTGGSAIVSLDDVSITSNSGEGIRVDLTNGAAAAGVSLTVDKVKLVGNTNGVALTAPAGNTVPVRAMVTDTMIAGNSAAGVTSSGSPIVALFSGTTITGNAQGVVSTGSTVVSYQDNRLFGNTFNNSFPVTLPKN